MASGRILQLPDHQLPDHQLPDRQLPDRQLPDPPAAGAADAAVRRARE
jgi:hypothetical protein